MISQTGGQSQSMTLENLDSPFPRFSRTNISPDSDAAGSSLGGNVLEYETGYMCNVLMADEIQERLRLANENAEVQKEISVQLTPVAQVPAASTPTPTTVSAPTLPTSSAATAAANAPSSAPNQVKNTNNSSDHQDLIDRLNKIPHVANFHGVVLTRNERLQIIAAIALCESGHDPFTAENRDTEFHHAPTASLTYGRIVHIGLSYGIIQFTQDSGSLGKLLQRMQQKDAGKFSEIFGNNSAELITLTTTGISVPGVNYESGQAHWNSIRSTPQGVQLSNLAAHHHLPVSSEIRGKRVQPIAVDVGGQRRDLWEHEWAQRFIEAGKHPAFQEAELDFAVEGYMNRAIIFCKHENIRSALGIAFVTACFIRGAKKELITVAAKLCGAAVPFAHGDDERRAVQYIANLDPTHAQQMGGITVQKDEIIRARTLLKDETGFLAEDLYDPDTYTSEYDH